MPLLRRGVNIFLAIFSQWAYDGAMPNETQPQPAVALWEAYDEDDYYLGDDDGGDGDDDADFTDCAQGRDGSCGKAGSEECDFECPFNRS